MRKALLCSFMLTVLATTTFPQPPDTVWTRTYGGEHWDIAQEIQQTVDGGYIIAGYTSSFGAGSLDCYLVRIDSDGDTCWTKTYGGDEPDRACSVQQTTDGGFILVGDTRSYGAGSSDIFLVKTDHMGDTLWTRTWGAVGDDVGYAVQQTDDGGYIIAGMVQGGISVVLLKTDNLGNTVWENNYEGDELRSVRQTSDGGYIAVGWITNQGNYDVYLVKTDTEGDTIWTRTLGESLNQEQGISIGETMDGGFIIAGYIATGDFQDFYLIKTNGLGEILWSRNYGGPDCDKAFSVKQTPDGGYILAGVTGG